MIKQLHSANIYQILFYIPHNYDYMTAQGSTVVSDCIDIMKTTFGINLINIMLLNMHGYT